MTNLNCRYCKRELKPLNKGDIRIISCKSCKSEEWIHKDGNTENWQFQVGFYMLSYSFNQKRFTIRKVGGTGEIIVDISLPNDPSYMTPDSMTEERIKSIILFS